MDYTQPLDNALVQKLPSPKGVALAIMEACQSELVTSREIAALVVSDPALTGLLLEHANVATMGGRAVASMVDAVDRLGLRTVRHLTLGFSLVEHYTSGACKQFDYKGFWSHSLLMAVAVRELGNPLRLASGDELFVLGLLSRVGCLALATGYPLEYSSILQSGARGKELLQLEQSTLALDHLKLGAALLHRWGIPKIFIDAVLAQETPPRSIGSRETRQESLHKVLHIALQISDCLFAADAERAALVDEVKELAIHCALDESELNVVIETVTQQWRQLATRFKLQTRPASPFSVMSKTAVHPENPDTASRLNILVVDDDPITVTLVSTWLRREGKYVIRTATDGLMAQKLALDFKPHVVITDWRMPNVDGTELCKALRATQWGQKIYVLMLTAADQEDELVHAFDAGVDDYLCKPVNLLTLGARLKAAFRYVRLREAWERDHERITRMSADLALTNRRLQLAAQTDPLTGLANRRAGVTALTQLWSTASRHGHKFSVISLDLDHFKDINDKYGHAAGDCVLQRVGAELKGQSRNEDTVCRWGGEEFLVILPNLDEASGILTAERLRNTIARAAVTFEGRVIHVTVSLGVVEWLPDMAHYDQLLAEVDRVLYEAKRSGRNRTLGRASTVGAATAT
jgi:two-component system, cell cycle response regulator